MKFYTQTNNKSERGAALISTLLISALLLAAGGMLILTTSMTGTNTIDAAAEMQAYYGAEAGLQATLNVLRGGVPPNPLFAANPVGGVHRDNIIDFRKALTRNTSNLAGDPLTADIRLSRWLTYNYTPSGGTYADRVAISPGYPLSGVAYKVKISEVPPASNPPQRLIIESTGYGPRGARKTLSMMVSANGLNITVPAALVIRGHDNASTPAFIDLGQSNAKTYSGIDNAEIETTPKASLAISAHDITTAQEAYEDRPGTVDDPKFDVLDLPHDPAPDPLPADASVAETPWFLKTANDARAFLVLAENLANSCLAPGSPCVKRGVVVNSLSGNAGSAASPQFTIVKGNCNLNSGAGLLIVTGTLTIDGPGADFDGVILVLGGGTVIKTGGGNRDIFGSVMVARFGATGDFLAPTFNYNDGAGNSNLQYDSRAVLDAILMPGATVLGVVEK
jgi:hypothetical protein